MGFAAAGFDSVVSGRISLGTCRRRQSVRVRRLGRNRHMQSEQEKRGDQASGLTIYIMHAFHNAVSVYISAGMLVNSKVRCR